MLVKSDRQMSLMSVNFGGVHVQLKNFFFLVWMCSKCTITSKLMLQENHQRASLPSIQRDMQIPNWMREPHEVSR